jgi:hypothetical protein
MGLQALVGCLAQPEQQEHKEHKASKGQLEIKVQPDQVAFKERRVHLVFKAQQDPVQQAHLERRAQPA